MSARDRGKRPYIPAFTSLQATKCRGIDDMRGIDVWAQLECEAADLIGADNRRLPIQIKSSVGGEIEFVRLAAELDTTRRNRGIRTRDREVLMLNGARAWPDIRLDCAIGLVQYAGLELKVSDETEALLEHCFHPEIVQAALDRIDCADVRKRKGFEHTIWPNAVIQGTVVQLPEKRIAAYHRRERRN